MKLLQSFMIAFSMYSKIPVPRVTWTKENMKYALCFFPLVGVVTGSCVWLAGSLLLRSGCGRLFYAVIMTLVPVVISGGIHLDGFMDTIDALSSYGDREKKLAILNDPHAGSFAVLGICCYFLLTAAFWGETTVGMLPVIAGGYVLSRAMSGFAVVIFPAAKQSGLARTFQEGANRQHTGMVMVLCALAAGGFMLYASPLTAVAAIAGAVIVLVYYRLMAMRQFGGITGDLAGYFLQLCELAILIGTVLAGGGLWN